MWQLIDTKEIEGFTIHTYVEPETDNPRDHFMVEGSSQLGLTESMPEIVEGIISGRYEWFRVMVTANKCGVELGSDHLGGCCYVSYQEFLEDAYWADMAGEAITEAKAIIEELKK